MKILHINSLPDGGAAWCARRINNALVQQGIESRMLFALGTSMPEGIEGSIAQKDKSIWYSNWFTAKLKHLINRIPIYMDADKLTSILEGINRNLSDSVYAHHPLTQYKNIARYPLIEWADIVHLHWVPDFVDYPTFFKKVNKPIVWTLHDKYPAVGIQHYCSEFSPLPEQLKEFDSLCRRIKRKGMLNAKDMHIVAISEYMQRLCHDSDVLKGFPCTIIHNGVDTNIFKPLPIQWEIKDQLRSLQDGTVTFMFSAFGIWDKNKGLDRLIEALEKVKYNLDKPIALIVVGECCENENKPIANFPIISTGLIGNQSKLASLYTFADFFVQASFEETFAQTPLEAMACGTPVVSTPCSGASDLIRPFNGVICDGYDSDAIADGIEKALHHEYDSNEIREYIVRNYEYSIIAKQYIELYQHILQDI